MAGPPDNALEALRKVCADVREGLPEEGVLGVEPSYVAVPATVAEAGEVMRVAAERDLAVVPRGAETRLDWGRPPARCDLLVDTARLDRVIEHAAGDLVVKVEAGLTLDRLAEVLATERQQLALDAPLPGSTVGGTLAAGAAGPRRLLYGSARDLLIGITVVRADGSIAKSGGKVVKNVAGYDLGKLFTGSYGTLGLIVEAAFRLHPIPAAQTYVTAAFTAPAEAAEAVQRVLHSPLVPAAIEINVPAHPEPTDPAPPHDASATELPARDTAAQDASAHGGVAITVGVLVEGVPQGVEARAAAVAELLGADARSSGEPPSWWGGYPDGSTLIEIAGPPTSVPGVLEALEPFRSDVPELAVRGSAGTGSLHLGLDTAPETAARILAVLRDTLVPLHGRAVVRYAPEPVRDGLDPWGPVPALPLMRRVKDQFDPGHRLSPGRFVGGI